MIAARTRSAREHLRGAVGGLPRTYWVLWLATLVNKVGAFVVPFLSLYLVRHRGLSVTEAGVLFAVYGAGCVLANPLGGWVSDRYGRRVGMLTGLCGGAMAVLLLGEAEGRGALAGAAFLLGLLMDLYRPSVMAIVTDVVEPPDRMRAFSLLYWAINVGFTASPLIAGALGDAHVKWLFWGDAATTLACAGLVYAYVPESRPEPVSGTEEDRSGPLAPFADKVFLPFVAVNFLVALLFFQFFVAMPADMAAQGLGTQAFGMAIAVNGGLIVLLQPVVGTWVERMRRGHALAAGALLTGLGFGLYGWVTTLGGFAAGVAVWTVGEMLMSPVNSGLVADLAPETQRARYQGAYNTAWSLAVLVGPALGGWALETVGRRAFWTVVLGVGVLAAVLHLALVPARRARLGAAGRE
ncbi:MAG: hypothetical protein RL653_399 [Pseudomonadota bacterium]